MGMIVVDGEIMISEATDPRLILKLWSCSFAWPKCLGKRWASTMIPPYEPQSEKLPGVASWAECRYWWPAALAFVVQSFLTFFTGGFTLFIFVVEIIEAAGGSRRAAGVIVVLFGVAKLLATLGVVAACVEIKILRRVHAIDATRCTRHTG